MSKMCVLAIYIYTVVRALEQRNYYLLAVRIQHLFALRYCLKLPRQSPTAQRLVLMQQPRKQS
jgi:hypothetical protein